MQYWLEFEKACGLRRTDRTSDSVCCERQDIGSGRRRPQSYGRPGHHVVQQGCRRDGRLVAGELVGVKLLDGGTLMEAVSLQGATREERLAYSREQVAALFQRADLDGDGLLGVEEQEAEGMMRRAANLDGGGRITGPVFHLVGDKGWDQALAPEDIGASAGLGLKIDPSSLRPREESRHWAMVQALLAETGPSQPAAPWSVEAGRTEFARELGGQPLSDELAARLMIQLAARTAYQPTPAPGAGVAGLVV